MSFRYYVVFVYKAGYFADRPCICVSFRTKTVCKMPSLRQLSMKPEKNQPGFETGSGKNGQKSGFSTKFKEAVPKTEVLGKPL
ncbi:MAG: hypothetical protein LBE10_03205 [Treponema sp.]|nr:hypothetical protein [Treponema sp.]